MRYLENRYDSGNFSLYYSNIHGKRSLVDLTECLVKYKRIRNLAEVTRILLKLIKSLVNLDNCKL